AVDRGDQWLGVDINHQEQGAELAPFERLVEPRAPADELLQIGPGAERLPGADQGDGLDLGIVARSGQRAIQRPYHRRTERVAGLGPVQPEREDAVGPPLEELAGR